MVFTLTNSCGVDVGAAAHDAVHDHAAVRATKHPGMITQQAGQRKMPLQKATAQPISIHIAVLPLDVETDFRQNMIYGPTLKRS